MGTDIHLVVEAYDGERWRYREDWPGWSKSVWVGNDWMDLRVGLRSLHPQQRCRALWPLLRDQRSWVVGRPDDVDAWPLDLDWGDWGFMWATLEQLLVHDWTPATKDGHVPGFVRWLQSPELVVWVDQCGGADCVRVMWGWDS